MKFYSEKLDAIFDTAEELKAAEKSTKKKSKQAAAEEVVKEKEIPTKKQLATEVEQAEEAVKTAYADYEAARARVEEMSKTYLESVNNILDPAKKAIKDAEQKRYDAIRRFNESYGAYQVTLTGSRAAEEMIKALDRLNTRTLNSLVGDWFWR